MQQITFTNSSGQIITLGNVKPYILLSFSGTGAVETDVQMQKAPFQNGKTYIDTLLEPRSISMEVAILASSQEEVYQHRREISRVFNPKLGPGTLRYEYDGGVKEIQAVSELAPVFPEGKDNSAPGFQRVLLSLLCPSPFWLDETTESQEMAAWLGGISFPLSLPTSFAEVGSERTLTNDGDVETPVTIEFHGPATNPKVENVTTGEFIRVVRELVEGDTLVITTAFGQKGVTLRTPDGESNAMHWIDLDSTFWQLIPGDNRVKYSADIGTEQATVKITWKNRFIGI